MISKTYCLGFLDVIKTLYVSRCFLISNLFSSFALYFLGPPDAPSITNITVDRKQCSLQWTRPYNGESPIGIYTIYIWVTNNGNVNSWNTTETNYTLELDWGQNYTVDVSAWNEYGESSSLSEKHFRTGRVPQGNWSFGLRPGQNCASIPLIYCK